MTTKTDIKIYTDMQKAYENIQRAIISAEKIYAKYETLFKKNNDETWADNVTASDVKKWDKISKNIKSGKFVTLEETKKRYGL